MSVHFLDELFMRDSHCGRFEARIEEEKAVVHSTIPVALSQYDLAK